jgi:carbohydrate-selective porin OprB
MDERNNRIGHHSLQNILCRCQTSHILNLSWDKVYFDTKNISKIGLNLILQESDDFNMMKLCLQQVTGMANIAKAISFLGNSFNAYLNYNQSLITSATLIEFSMTPQFFTL